VTTTTHEATLQCLDIDPVLLSAIVRGVVEGLAMTGIAPPPVGASRLVSTSRPIAVVVGMVGLCNGSLTLSFDERTMLFVAGALMGETQKEVTEENLDAIGEVANMVAGRIKEALVGTPCEVSNISVPSIVMGASYSFYCTRGFNTCSVEFEVPGIAQAYLRDRFFTATLSLMKSR
jgi:chemotaxis protein CheX